LGTIDRDTVFVLPENGGDISSEEENGHETSTTITQSTENLQEVATTSVQVRQILQEIPEMNGTKIGDGVHQRVKL
jgi:hypothetical protein